MKTSEAAIMLTALAQESRLEIVRMLIEAGSTGLAAGVIANKLGIAAPTMSFHLSQLKTAGLVDVRRDGRLRIYSIRMDPVTSLVGFMFENCCNGHPELCIPSGTDNVSKCS